MAAIIDNTTDIKKYLSVNSGLDFNTIKPYIDNALIEYIEQPWLGEDVIADIESNISSNTAPYPEIVERIQRTLTYFSVLKGLPFFEVNIGDEGITRTESENFKTAYRGQVARIERQLKADAYNSLDRLLDYLEENKATYPLWTTAPGHVEYSNYFFKNAVQFSFYYPLKYGRLTYNRILPSMRYVTEFLIKKEIGEDQYDDFFSKKTNNSISPIEAKAFLYLRHAIANLTIAQSLIDGWTTLTASGVHFTEQTEDTGKETNADNTQMAAKISTIESRGKSYLAKLVKLMNNNLDDFPDFRDDSDIIKNTENTSSSPGGVKGFYGV